MKQPGRLVDDKDWFGAVNRFYYAVYQGVSALMTQADIRIKSHSGAEAMFELHFIKTGKVEPMWGNYMHVCPMSDTKVIMQPSPLSMKTIFSPYYRKPKNSLALSNA